MKRGFTIFFAVLVSSLALSVGLAIYDLLIRELALSQVATQSQLAIYAADTGAECALYWDNKYNTINVTDSDGSAFATSSATQSSDYAQASQALCNLQDITNNATFAFPWTITNLTANSALTTFKVSMGSVLASPCATVTVSKVGNPPVTTVVSHGFNACSSAGVIRVERALQVTY